MEGILLTTDQIKWFQEMLVEGFDDERVQHRTLGALEFLMRQPAKNWVPALNNNNNKEEEWKPIYAEEIAHKSK